jgi:hypothetical protein
MTGSGLAIQIQQEGAMEPEKTVVCRCDNCGNEAEMTIKCEVVAPPQAPGAPEQLKRTLVCTRCGNEADLLVDYARPEG